MNKKTKGLNASRARRRRIAILMLLLMIPILAGIILMGIPRQGRTVGPVFTDEGDLRFIDAADGSTLATIDIEVADDDLSRERGLMYRQKMEEDQGMLFIMEAEEPQSFWMLNTLLALDIIFVNEAREIVNIQADRQPKSLDQVPSTGPARYVVEVVAGFCARHQIEAGDRIAWDIEPAR